VSTFTLPSIFKIGEIVLQSKTIEWLKGLAHFWKDLLLLVLGIYLALWMENEVQSWSDNDKQREYMHRLSIDLASDEKQIETLIPLLEVKISKLQFSVEFLQNQELDIERPDVLKKAIDTGSTINNYHFFSPQDFTFLSMRESGDFGLLKDDDIKTLLLKLNSRYQFIELLQNNYLQGLDDEFIPMWVRHVDMLNGVFVHPEVISQLIFKNMVAFAWNETNQRKDNLLRTLSEVKGLRAKLEHASQ
jgi:hypothetical protein